MANSPEGPLVFFIVAGFILVATVVGSYYRYFAGEKRREGLIDLGRRLDLTFVAGPNYAIADQYDFLKQLARGDNRYACNVLSGKYEDCDVLAFDYHYEITTEDKNGTHTSHYYFSFFILTLPLTFPRLTIRPENMLSRIAEMFGYQDIQFESAEFSRAFCVRSEDKKFAYDVCNAQMMEYLLANRDVNIEIESYAMALVFDSRLSVEQFEMNLNRLVQLCRLLPTYLFTPTV